jgi:four helix bundle protein
MTKFKKNQNNKYDLEERLACFAEQVIDLARKLPQDAVNIRLIPQVVSSSGSSGANYNEANEAESKKDFSHKISIVKKELRETKLWLRLLARANPKFQKEFRELWKEAHELNLIFAKIKRSCG